MTTTDPTTLALTGQLPFILMVSGVFGLLLSFLLLRLYRRALLRGMARRGPAAVASETPAAVRAAPEPPPTPLVISSAEAAGDGELSRRARKSLWQTASVYGAGGALFAALLALAFLRAGGMELLPLRFLLLFWVFAWPLVLTLALVATSSRRGKLLLVAAYGAGYGVLSLAGILRSPDSSFGQLAVLWTTTNLPPTLLFLVVLLRRVRAVGPLVVTLLVFALTGSNLLLTVLDRNQTLLGKVAGLFFSLGLGGTATFWALTVIGFALFAVLGWFALQGLRRSYQAKWINDQSLVLDALWLLFGISYAVTLAFEGAAWVAAGPVAFAAYLATVRLGFRLLTPGGTPEQSRRLLVLRVFSLGKRSETLFEAVSRHWRYLGTVQLIAGPDLAAATVEPHEFLDFVSGRLERQFIDTPDALARRLAELDTLPDFDGRFRVNDFFCHDDTWQATLAALVRHSDAVLMDLRGFTPERQGCVYEVRKLVDTALLDRVVMVVDSTTDTPFLERTLREAWDAMADDSPNRQGGGELRLLRLERADGKGIARLVRLLCQASG